MPETWKPIPGWEGYYEVSDQGRVRSKGREIVDRLGRPSLRKGKILTQDLSSKGYPSVRLSRNGVKLRKSVHRLVVETFRGGPPRGAVACHNDGNPNNNHLTNLRWDTQSENNRDKVRHGTCHESKKSHCPRGHEFVLENIAPWYREGRTCLACSRARSYCKKYGLMDRFEEYADKYFEALFRRPEAA